MGITIIELETFFTKQLPLQVKHAGTATVTRINRVVKKKAIEVYKSKRKKNEMPSEIIDSIRYDMVFSPSIDIHGVVFCGSPRAIFLEEDRVLRNGKLWSSVNSKAPYYFMWEGWRAGDEAALKIALEELNKNIR